MQVYLRSEECVCVRAEGADFRGGPVVDHHVPREHTHRTHARTNVHTQQA